jgi:hypothetical protein
MTFSVYIEVGQKRTFAGAIEWPGWCRSGKDEATALQALLDYGGRYERVLRGTSPEFKAPARVSGLRVVERLRGTTTTDFGAPDRTPTADEGRITEPELMRFEALMQACWAAFYAAAESAKGKILRLGPRGGGRHLVKMVEHVREAEEAYIVKLGWQVPSGRSHQQRKGLVEVNQAALDGLRASARGGIPTKGPRGGKRWSPRYFVRRTAWHVLDHAWEIENRLG